MIYLILVLLFLIFIFLLLVVSDGNIFFKILILISISIFLYLFLEVFTDSIYKFVKIFKFESKQDFLKQILILLILLFGVIVPIIYFIYVLILI